MILPAQDIRSRCVPSPMRNAVPNLPPFQPMVNPFVERSVAHGMSYGLSAAGYDVRVKQRRILRPGAFVLASTVEHFDMPNDVLGHVADKSTWARRGITVQNTIIEPGWRGWLTLEIANHGDAIVELEEGMPIAQIIFHLLAAPTELPYGGKYQDQEDKPVPARIEG